MTTENEKLFKQLMSVLFWLDMELNGSFVEDRCSNSPLDLHCYGTLHDNCCVLKSRN